MTTHSASKPWRLLLTGTPGTGKTELAHFLGKKLQARVIEEKTVASKKGVGIWDAQTKEYDVDLKKLQAALKKELQHEKKPVILEGHLSCEFKLPVDGIILLTCPLPVLEKRLRKRGYSELKIQDNLFCEETEYCETGVQKNYSRVPTRKIATHRPKKVIRATLLNWILRHVA